MFELSLVLAFALLPVAGNLVGSMLAESVRAPRWVIGASLHAAAGIAIGVVSIQLVPRILQTAPAWLMIAGFLVGALISLALATGLHSWRQNLHGSPGAWMVWVAVGSDLISDGVMTGAGSAVANIPGGFAATANLRHQGVARKRRMAIAALLALPVLISAGLGFWLLRDASAIVQSGALAAIVGVLLLTTVEDIVPQGDAPQPARWASTAAFAGGFVLLALLTKVV